MADSNTETATPAAESSVQRGSEFSKPTGDGDQALWEKHFGGEDAKSGEEPKRPTSNQSEKSGSQKGDGEASAKSGRDKSGTDSKETSRADSAKRSESRSEKSEKRPTESKPDRSAKEPSKSEKKPADSEATGQKTAEETDPEA